MLSNGFKDNFDTFVRNAVDLASFLTDGGLEKLQKRVQSIMMNHYLCRYASYWSDISSLTPEDFNCSLYDWYIRTIGVDTATTFKMETQLADGLRYITPKAILKKQNACRYHHKCSAVSKNLIFDTDKQYFNRFGY